MKRRKNIWMTLISLFLLGLTLYALTLGSHESLRSLPEKESVSLLEKARGVIRDSLPDTQKP